MDDPGGGVSVPVTSSSVSEGDGDREEASGSKSRMAKLCGGVIAVRHRGPPTAY